MIEEGEMFLWRFFVGSWFGALTGIFSLIVLLVVLFFVITSLFLITGGPSQCTPGDGAITVDSANAKSFKTKWDALDASLSAGTPAGASFSESELSSRAQEFVDESNAPFKDVRICIHNGYGEGTADLSVIGIGVKFKVKGSVDLSGTHPKAHIDDIEAGSVPGFIVGAIDRLIKNAVGSALDDIDLKHKYTPTLTDGSAKIDGQP